MPPKEKSPASPPASGSFQVYQPYPASQRDSPALAKQLQATTKNATSSEWVPGDCFQSETWQRAMEKEDRDMCRPKQ